MYICLAIWQAGRHWEEAEAQIYPTLNPGTSRGLVVNAKTLSIYSGVEEAWWPLNTRLVRPRGRSVVDRKISSIHCIIYHIIPYYIIL